MVNAFGKTRITLDRQDEGVKDNRIVFINMCNTARTKLMNIMFQKGDQKLITHKHSRATLGPPWTRGDYEMIDYIIVANRWNNSVLDVEADIAANIESDHGPIRGNMRVTLKRHTIGEQDTN